MYTQCPDCATAFRVTADVLKQAAGKVRCGGCGNAFNALMYLSESKPESSPEKNVGEVLPELKPESDDDSTGQSSRPKKMSAEQSAALLKTLDELAGSDIQLEDTGVEWRLLGESDILDEAEVDEILNDAPTRVDELLTDSPTETDAGEVFENLDSAIDADEVFEDIQVAVEASEVFDNTESPVESAEVFEESSTPGSDELRFDDNTGLPDDFDFEARAEIATEPEPDAEPTLVPELEPAAVDDAGNEIALGDPDEWGELLDEVATPVEANAAAPDAQAPSVDDFRGAIIEPEPTAEADDGISLAEELAALPDDDDVLEPEPPEDIPLDIDTQFDLQAEAMGIDLSGIHKPDNDDEPAKEIDDEPDEEIDLLDTSIEEDLIAAAFESEDTDDSSLELEDKDEFKEFELLHELNAGDDVDDSDEETEFPDSTGELEVELSRAQEIMDELEASGSFVVDEIGTSGDDAPEELEEPEEIAETPESDHDVPTPTNEEQTLNMQIDRDLMRLAIEDEDGFASTMVLQGKKKPTKQDDEDDFNDIEEIEAIIAAEDPTPDEPEARDKPDASVETIIMEGDFVRTPLEEEALREIRESGEIDEEKFEKAAKETFYGKLSAAGGGFTRYRVMAGGLVLVLLLIVQLVHQWRADLARIPAVNGIIAPIYRAFGAPIIPNWDVTGWRFEKTVGSTNGLTANVSDDGANASLDPVDGDTAAMDDAALTDDTADATEATDVDEAPVDETLTIYSRIGNTSDTALPYPLITVALTDRYEETIGSSVLEPGDYLAHNANLRAAVAPGATFDAVIAINAPAANATGFKLNVCYRQTADQLRCAIEDFK